MNRVTFAPSRMAYPRRTAGMGYFLYRYIRRYFGTAPCFVQKGLPHTFDKILIANRGEIACRVIKTARKLGVKTVAIYSDADVDAMHVKMADEAYRVGGPEAKDSYLLGDRVLDIVARAGAQAVHPGYGFLSENAQFAEKCAEAGVTFIGPPTDAIVAMGSKSASKLIMEKANVPVVPGYHGDEQSIEILEQEADRVGYPLMIKAILGGGGKGMRVVKDRGEFLSQLNAAKGEAMSSFSDDRVLLERYIARSRHVEFQVFADKHGNVVHLNERDCSVQRRNQKVLEESPAPGMTAELREKMGRSAVEAAKAVGYVGAGTIEFIVDADTEEYFFMEMNTRLQVEHPVTEMITQTDLVQWQLHVAAGHTLPSTQKEIGIHGYSIEARIYAETPDKNFLPCTGKLLHLSCPSEDSSVRVETAVEEGDELCCFKHRTLRLRQVSVYYDPMIAKLVVWSPDRVQGLKKLSNCLEKYQIVGLPTNIQFLQRSVVHPEFQEGKVTTSFINDNLSELVPDHSQTISPDKVAMAVTSLLLREKRENCRLRTNSNDSMSPWLLSKCTRLNLTNSRTISLLYGPEEEDESRRIEVDVEHIDDGSYVLKFDDNTITTEGRLSESGDIRLRVNDKLMQATVVHTGSNITVFSDGNMEKLRLPEDNFDTSGDGGYHKGAVAPMPGRVVEVLVKDGEIVQKGDVLMVIEAMKMRHDISAAKPGTVQKLLFNVGDLVDADELLVEINEG
eukprot:798507_1